MNKALLISTVLLFCLKAEQARSQASKFLSHTELGFMAGAIHYAGDLNPRFGLLHNIGPAGSVIFTRVPANDRWSWRNVLSAGRFSASDKFSNDDFLQNRNLSVRTFVAELNTQVVFNFLPYEIGGKSDKFVIPMTPYVFFGAGFFYFIPKANYQGTWYNLRFLDTEGQGTVALRRKRALPVQMSFPFGMGFKFSPNDLIGIGLEWGLRKTYTDYLDDVSKTYPHPQSLLAERGATAVALSDPSVTKSDTETGNYMRQRGTESTKDWYSIVGITVVWRINDNRGKCPGY